MDMETAARCFAELGHPSRLAVYQRLVQAGEQGMPVGAIAEELGIVLSTLSHHIKQLVQAGLVEQVREGRSLVCRPVYPRMDGLVAFLTEQCCARPVAVTVPAVDCCAEPAAA